MAIGKIPRSVYESMTRGELIDALCAADVEPTPNSARAFKSLQDERDALAEQVRVLSERSEHTEVARTHFADLFEHAPVAYVLLDRNGVIRGANAGAATLLCTTAAALEGVALSRIAGIEEQQILVDHVARCLDERLRVVSELKMNVRGRGELVVELASTPRLDVKGSAESARTVLHDVTRRHRGADVAQFLARVDDLFGDALDADGTAAAVAHACVPVLGDAAFVDLCDDGVFARRAGVALAPEQHALREIIHKHAEDPAWRRYVERVVETKDSVFDPSSGAAFGVGVAAKGFVLVPLIARTRVLGVLGALRVQGRAYSLEELELAQKVARRTARAIDDADALARVRASSASRPPPR